MPNKIVSINGIILPCSEMAENVSFIAGDNVISIYCRMGAQKSTQKITPGRSWNLPLAVLLALSLLLVVQWFKSNPQWNTHSQFCMVSHRFLMQFLLLASLANSLQYLA